MEKVLSDELKKMQPKFCALATSSQDGHPQVAFMAYAITDSGHILMSTDLHSRKVHNLNANRHVAITIGWDATKINYQIEGEAAIIIEDDAAHKSYQEVYYKQNPHLAHFRDIPNHIFIRILPFWIRSTDYSIKPPMITETKLR